MPSAWSARDSASPSASWCHALRLHARVVRHISCGLLASSEQLVEKAHRFLLRVRRRSPSIRDRGDCCSLPWRSPWRESAHTHTAQAESPGAAGADRPAGHRRAEPDDPVRPRGVGLHHDRDRRRDLPVRRRQRQQGRDECGRGGSRRRRDAPARGRAAELPAQRQEAAVPPPPDRCAAEGLQVQHQPADERRPHERDGDLRDLRPAGADDLDGPQPRARRRRRPLRPSGPAERGGEDRETGTSSRRTASWWRRCRASATRSR